MATSIAAPLFSPHESWWVAGGVLAALLAGLLAWWRASFKRLNRRLTETTDALDRAIAAQRIGDERLKVAFAIGTVGICVTDPEGTIRHVNSRYSNFLRYGKDELIDRSILDLIHPDDRDEFLAMRACLTSGGSDRMQVEHRFVRRDGETVWGLSDVYAFRAEDGSVDYVVGNVRDITERKQAERALVESEQSHRAVVELSPDAIIVNRDGIIVYANSAAAQCFAASCPEDLIGMTGIDLIHPEDREFVLRRRAESTARGAPTAFKEYRLLRLDGVELVGEGASTNLVWDGEPARLIVLRDVTVRKQNEAELVRKTGLLDLMRATAVIANDASDLKAAIGATFEIVCKHFGWVIGHAYLPSRCARPRMIPSDIWYISDAERFAPFMAATQETTNARGRGMVGRVWATGRPEWTANYRNKKTSRRLDVARRVGLQSNFAVPVLAGTEVVAVLEFFSDRVAEPDDVLLETMAQVGTQLGRVAERERAAEAHRANEIRLRKIIDLVPHMIFIKDARGRYLLANEAVARMHGTTTDRIVGGDSYDLLRDPVQVEAFRREDLAVIETGQPLLIPEQKVMYRQGRGKIFRTIKVPYEVGEIGETAVLGVAVDITELKTAEDNLRHAQRLEAIGQLTGGLAHDFNNLLTIILGNLQLLLRHLDDPAEAEFAVTAEMAARRGADLTQRLLAFGRRQSLDPRITDLNRLVAGMTDMLRRTLGEPITIETVTPHAAMTLVDRPQVENAILNLAINARDAMPRGGTLTIRTGERRIDRELLVGRDTIAPGAYVVLAVTDTGTGMSAEVAGRAFDPFFTTKDVGSGSGLGLSTIYGFCRQSGGFATIDSEPGEGTTVSLFLPAAEGIEQVAAKEQRETCRQGGSETVLVVEDDPGVRVFATSVLSGLNYKVLQAEDGKSALEMLRSNGKVDLLFTDVVLPGGVDGRDLAARARRHQPDIGVLYTSGFAARGEDAARVRDGMSMLRKPYTGDDLMARVRTLLDAPQRV